VTAVDGAVVLVTGANGGLGREFVRQARERGAVRVYAAARNPAPWDDEGVVPIRLDVTDVDSVREAASAAGDVSIVVNNAGVLRSGPLVDGDLDGVREQMETNFFGPLLVTRAFAPALRRSRGAVVNVASALSWTAIGNGYSASKAALWSATDSIRLELAPDGVQVVGAYLAFTDTPMTPGDMPKNDPADVVAAVLDGVESGEHEVLADDLTRAARAGLSAPVHERYGALAAPGSSTGQV
jgi:NAD(P)-dependent dehydrogenase (short-subunit alcohol dehydrogenase family)